MSATDRVRLVLAYPSPVITASPRCITGTSSTPSPAQVDAGGYMVVIWR